MRDDDKVGDAQVEVLTNHIGGFAVAAASGKTIDDFDPATGLLIARVPDSDARDIDAAVAAARAAFVGGWRDSSAASRADLLDRIADRIEERIEELARLESLDTGKPLWLARQVDIPRAVANFRFFAGAARHDHTPSHAMPGAINYTLRRPVGVAGLITPWNLPLYLLSWKAAPALAMGNTVVAKPSEMTPISASALAEIITEVGAPPGVFNLVHGTGASAGQALVAHPEVPIISFTGGTATGARVAAAAAPMFKKLSLELGGKNPSIVFADCDRNAALEGVLRAAFTNQGQVCLCGSRILIERSIFAEFREALVQRARALVVGDPALETSKLGALISRAHLDKVDGYVRLAREEGGKILTGGQPLQMNGRLSGGWYYAPTVIDGLESTCRAATEEIFGPVITLHPFDSEAEALAMACGVEYGLCAMIWTRDLARAHRMAAAIDTGMVWVNTWLMRDLRTPFGGTKRSGVGREGGDWSLDFYSEVKNVCIYLGEHQ